LGILIVEWAKFSELFLLLMFKKVFKSLALLSLFLKHEFPFPQTVMVQWFRRRFLSWKLSQRFENLFNGQGRGFFLLGTYGQDVTHSQSKKATLCNIFSTWFLFFLIFYVVKNKLNVFKLSFIEKTQVPHFRKRQLTINNSKQSILWNLKKVQILFIVVNSDEISKL
jgi:hypothetical protein